MQNEKNVMKQDQKELFDVVVDYTYALDTLDNYDYQRLRWQGDWYLSSSVVDALTS